MASAEGEGSVGPRDRAPDEDWKAQPDDLVSERARRFATPSLRGRHVYLRAVIPEDYTYLQLFETSSDVAPRWRLRGRTPSPQDWMQGSWTGVLAQFMVISNRDQARVGQVTAYEPNFQDGHARLAATRFDPSGRSPLMMLGFALFVEYVFRCWNFHKLYMEAPEYNYPSFASGFGRLFTVEGRLKQHYYLDGQLWDQIVLAIYRTTWRDHPKPVLAAEQAAEQL